MRLERWTAGAGLVFVPVTVAMVITESAGPDISKSAAQVAARIGPDRTDVVLNSVLHMVQGISVVVLGAALASLLVRRGTRHLAAQAALGFGMATAAASSVSAVLGATVAGSIHQLGRTDLPYLVYRAAEAAGTASTIFFAGVVLVMAVELGRLGLQPGAAAPVGVVASLVLAVGGFDYLSPDSGPLSALKALGGALTIVYVLFVSIRLLRGQATDDPGVRPATTRSPAVT